MYFPSAVLSDVSSSVSGRRTGRADVSAGHVLGSFQPGLRPRHGLSPGEPPRTALGPGLEAQSALVSTHPFRKGLVGN